MKCPLSILLTSRIYFTLPLSFWPVCMFLFHLRLFLYLSVCRGVGVWGGVGWMCLPVLLSCYCILIVLTLQFCFFVGIFLFLSRKVKLMWTLAFSVLDAKDFFRKLFVMMIQYSWPYPSKINLPDIQVLSY